MRTFASLLRCAVVGRFRVATKAHSRMSSGRGGPAPWHPVATGAGARATRLLRCAVPCLLLVLLPGATSAQLIPIRTVPVSQSHQFELFPSRALAMGGVSIAVADKLSDPFSNPATATRITAPVLFAAPALYSVTDEAGAGRTLPLGALAKKGAWYGGLAVALQQVDPSERSTNPVDRCPMCYGILGVELAPNDRPQGNEYVFALLGRDILGLSFGASVLWSGLNAVDGVDLLYNGSQRIEQFGHSVDIRLGALKEWSGGRSLELVALYNRFRMTHDVFYLDEVWNPDTEQTEQSARLEKNLDRTNAWGFHAVYEYPISGEGWRMGWLGTVNYKSHPKIPNYEIMSIPRDPGHSTALNFGLGFGRTYGGARFGLDIIFEPIWSHTWANAEGPVETDAGNVIPAGGMTIENHFRFANAVLRMGVGDELELTGPTTVAGLQLGLAVRRVHYWLEQQNHVELSDRDLEESWVEWTPTWGLTLRRPSFEIGYRGYVTHGTGRPTVQSFRCDVCAAGLVGSNILAAPSGPLALDPVRVFVHQISFSLPLNWGGLPEPRTGQDSEEGSGER